MLVLMMCLTLVPTNIVNASTKTALNTTSITITVGKSKTIKLKNYTKLNKKKIKKVKWSSSNKKVATVKYSGKYRQNAKITAKSTGTATIKVKFNGKNYSCKVTCIDNTNTTIPVTPTPIENDDNEDINHVHSFDSSEILYNATCNSNGAKILKCSCGETKTVEIPALGHTWSNEQIIKNATASETGIKSFTCSRCNEVKIEIIPANPDLHVHNYVESSTTATCTNPGTTTYTCKCGDSYTKDVEALGHDYDKEGICTRCLTFDSSIAGVTDLYDVSENQNNGVIVYTKDVNNNDIPEYYVKTLIPGERMNNRQSAKNAIFGPYMPQVFSKVDSITFVNKTLAPIDCNALFAFMAINDNIYNLSNLDTSNTTNMSSMFLKCVCANQLNLDFSNFNTSNVTSMGSMFGMMTTQINLDLSSFDTSKVTEMTYMFNGCEKLTSLDLTNFYVNNDTKLKKMFANCSKLNIIEVSKTKWTQTIDSTSDTFNNCGVNTLTYK